MSADPILTQRPADALFGQIRPSIGLAGPEPLAPEVDELRRQLDTERSAGKALLSTITEMQSRLTEERATSESLRAALESSQEATEFQRGQNSQLWGEIEILNGALTEELQKPIWRRMLRR